MRFYVHKRRQAPAIIIVALIDILIVLLIFLMVTTTFKQQPALKIVLPESSQAQKSGATESPPIVVAVDDKGNMRFGPEGKPITLERLRGDLRSEAGKKPDVKLSIMADRAAPVGQVIKVMDASKEAGITNNTLITKEPGKQ
jgi:biopolymer transport protein ExbD